MEGKIIYQGTSLKGIPFLIRCPKVGDAGQMMHYLQALSDEKTFIRFQGEKISLQQEEEFLTEQLQKIAENQTIYLLCFSGSRLIGISDLSLSDKVEKHVGALGISIAKEFRGEGIGKKLFETVLEESRKLKELRIITLGVFACNDLGRAMYKKYGFEEYGRLPKGILHKGVYVDHLLMYKNIS